MRGGGTTDIGFMGHPEPRQPNRFLGKLRGYPIWAGQVHSSVDLPEGGHE